MEVKIVPAILEKEFSGIEKKMQTIAVAARAVQIDVVDGNFVPMEKTFGSAGCEDSHERIAKITKDVELELDLMVELEKYHRFDKWTNAIKVSGAKRVVIHFGSTEKYVDIFSALEEEDIKIGLGVHISDNLNLVTGLLDELPFDFAQVMGIAEIGAQGQKFDERAVELVAKLHGEFPEMEISVDGGVSVGNAAALARAGATRLAAGSSIFKSHNPLEAIQKLSEAANENASA